MTKLSFALVGMIGLALKFKLLDAEQGAYALFAFIAVALLTECIIKVIVAIRNNTWEIRKNVELLKQAEMLLGRSQPLGVLYPRGDYRKYERYTLTARAA